MHGPFDIGTNINEENKWENILLESAQISMILERSFRFHLILLMEIKEVLND